MRPQRQHVHDRPLHGLQFRLGSSSTRRPGRFHQRYQEQLALAARGRRRVPPHQFHLHVPPPLPGRLHSLALPVRNYVLLHRIGTDLPLQRGLHAERGDLRHLPGNTVIQLAVQLTHRMDFNWSGMFLLHSDTLLLQSNQISRGRLQIRRSIRLVGLLRHLRPHLQHRSRSITLGFRSSHHGLSRQFRYFLRRRQHRLLHLHPIFPRPRTNQVLRVRFPDPLGQRFHRRHDHLRRRLSLLHVVLLPRTRK